MPKDGEKFGAGQRNGLKEVSGVAGVLNLRKGPQEGFTGSVKKLQDEISRLQQELYRKERELKQRAAVFLEAVLGEADFKNNWVLPSKVFIAGDKVRSICMTGSILPFGDSELEGMRDDLVAAGATVQVQDGTRSTTIIIPVNIFDSLTGVIHDDAGDGSLQLGYDGTLADEVLLARGEVAGVLSGSLG